MSRLMSGFAMSSQGRGALRLLAGFGLCLGLALLGGCATSTGSSVSVDSRAANARQPVTQGQYRVQRGDTLYSIASRYGWEWRALATHNRIAPPYTIHVGQVIRFGTSGQALASSPAPAVVAPVATSRAPGSAARPAAPVAAPSVPATTQVMPSARSASGWSWPAVGQVIEVFSASNSLNKGIDIAGDLGQPVLAAQDGSVVYAGSGLRGYGELVIIKHNDTYVSAYGHNRRLLVKEGQRVKVGQQIAEMGSTDTDRVKLHFEIRRQGKPVDPLQYLPRR